MSEAVRTENLRVLAMTTEPRLVRRLVTPAKRVIFTAEMVATITAERAREHPTPWVVVAEMIGISTGTLHRWAFERGFNTGKVESRAFNGDKRARLRALWPDATVSLSTIGKELDVGRDTVRREAARMGLGDRPPLALLRVVPKPRVRKVRESLKWPEATVARIRTLWAEGLPISVIAQRMGITPNSVIGKAHRLGLPSRPSPIRLQPGPGALKRPRRSYAERHPKEAVVVAADARRATGPGAPPPPPRPQAPVVRLYGRSEPCCWIIGEPAGRHTVFCDAPSRPGDSLCAKHRARCRPGATNRVEANAA